MMKTKNTLFFGIAVLLTVFFLLTCTLDAEIWANVSTYAGKAGDPGHVNSGSRFSARFENPELLALDNSGNIIVVENPLIGGWPYARLRKIIIGTGEVMDIPFGSTKPAHAVRGIAIDGDGNIFLSNHHRHNVQKFAPDGSFLDEYGPAMDDEGKFLDGPKDTARFKNPSGLAWDAHNRCLYVADTYNNRIRKIDEQGNVTTLAGSTKDYAEGTGSEAKFKEMVGLTMNKDGNIVVTDTWNHCIRMLTPEGESSIYASYHGSWGYKDGDANVAQVGTPQYLTCDNKGNIFFTDSTNHAIRKITPGRVVDAPAMPYNPYVNPFPSKVVGRFVGTVAGKAKWGSENTGEEFMDGNNVEARFNRPRGIAVTADGTIYVADMDNHCIRRIRP